MIMKNLTLLTLCLLSFCLYSQDEKALFLDSKIQLENHLPDYIRKAENQHQFKKDSTYQYLLNFQDQQFENTGRIFFVYDLKGHGKIYLKNINTFMKISDFGWARFETSNVVVNNAGRNSANDTASVPAHPNPALATNS